MKQAEKMYLVSYTAGQWDSFSRHTLFVTPLRWIAIGYVIRANVLLEKAKLFYSSEKWYHDSMDDSGQPDWYARWNRQEYVRELNGFEFVEIENRRGYVAFNKYFHNLWD